MSTKYSALIAAGVVFAAPALAADLPSKTAPAPEPVTVSMFDFAAGGKVMTDYNFRGISQSDRKPSGTAYFEGRLNINENFQVYAATQAWAVKLPTDPSAEVDLFGGVRATFGAFGLDVGVMRYWYPGETTYPGWVQSADFTEFYAKGTYTFNDMFSFGANVFYASNWLNTGASGTYASGTAKVTLPYDFSVSGELGRYFLGTTNAFYGFAKLPDYTYWNMGLTYTYKVLSLDLRYHDTNLSKTECSFLTGNNSTAAAGFGFGNGSNSSKWCSAAFIATLSVDITGANIK
ncbi:MAG: TorF family putative porin [Beijerinckiaceae bacterium]